MTYEYTIDEAFPLVSVDFEPTLNRVLVQLREPPKKTRGGIELPADTGDASRETTTIAKILAIGPLAFHKTGRGADWLKPEDMPKPGDYIAITKFVGNRYRVKPLDGKGEANLCVLDDTQIIGVRVVDPINSATFSTLY
jgi:co-chaperonin GroES (HSP10)